MLVWGGPGVPLPTGGPWVGKGPPDTSHPGADPAWGQAAGRLCGVTEGWRGSVGRGKQGLQRLACSSVSEALGSSRNDGELTIKESWRALSMLTRLSRAVKERFGCQCARGKHRPHTC